MPAATKTKICAACGEPFEAKRSDAKACSATCRSRLHRNGCVTDAVNATVNATLATGATLEPVIRVEPANRMKQAEREGKLEAWLQRLTEAGRAVSARELLGSASDDLWDAAFDFGRGPGWLFLRELVELAELVERESDKKRRRCA